MQMLLPPRVDLPPSHRQQRRTPTRAFSGESGGSWTWVVLTWVALGFAFTPLLVFLVTGSPELLWRVFAAAWGAASPLYLVFGLAMMATPVFAVVAVLQASAGWNRRVAIGTLAVVALIYVPGLLG